ncbi:MAG: carboxypeptidase-like regulatory domain-containing protein [Candidatus Cloacimonetes bacterium]|nr:carboxypeptidase-like regulatory domain-containing protein [Candidatus Cloacimonadota bacterium]MCF7813044.1 carboxypeptidase-like regulatory domain-containing protein [Candidatus Cloacimonadota bacterium]MCF7867215.1 carboxypeptidase-like regulatory domain-containing protein [Candidatus Cloacimonadota bacterium]MCF7882659.1 carboxypeptidase-like regulatory domain-containing protein [Candidatus Cloacimonadota bacterium]
MLKRILFLLLVTLFVSTSLFAGTTGKLAGKVTDESGNAVPFANVVLEGKEIGAQTDDKGTYIIINIPPGEYDIVCMRQGFQSERVTGVKINLDLTTILNFELSKDIVEIEGFTVTEAAIEMVQKTKTNSGRTINTNDIEDVAVNDLEGVIAIQAGVTEQNGELHIRGGRSNEVAYTVDGMSVSDPVDGGSALTVDMDAVEVTDVKTGGFTAEYGNAQSGIVNIITKSGSEIYSGKIEASSDHLIPGTLHSNNDETKFAFGGPVIPFAGEDLKKKFTFFLNGVGSWSDSRYWKHYKNDPNEELEYLTVESFEENDPYASRDDILGFDTGNRNYNDYNANIKLKYEFSPTSNITFAARGDKAEYNVFNYFWKYAMEHYQHYESSQQQFVTTYDHTFNSQTNLKIKASYYSKDVQRKPIGISLDDFFVQDEANFDYFAENQLYDCSGIDYLTDEQGLLGNESIYPWTIFTSSGVEEPLGSYTNFVRPGAIYGFFQDDENSILTLRSDFEYQYNEIHGFKTGFEFIRHDIKKNQVISPWTVDETRYQDFLNGSDPAYWFYDFSDLTEDEIDDYIATYNLSQKENSDYIYYNSNMYEEPAGEELDEYFTINTYDLDDYYNATVFASGQTDGYEANPYQAAYYLQDKMEWEGMIVNAGVRLDFWYLGEKYKIIKNGGIERWEEFDKDERFQMLVSPRLGVSHPISESSVLHFAYNYQNQLPQMQYIFTTYTEQDAVTSNVPVQVGKPSLEPQVTVTYEVGLQKQLSDDFVMDVNAYFKNIYNYPSLVQKESETDDNVTWLEWDSQDYGSARGIDFNLEKRLSSFIMGSASYSLAWAFGNNSDDVVQSETTDLREFPLDWDMRHNFTFNVTFRVQRGEDFYVPFTDFAVPQFITNDLSTNFNYNITSGTPYTPTTVEGNALETNSKLKPHYEKANLRLTKKIKLSQSTEKLYLRAYFGIDNLFNRRNVRNVYPITGSPYYDGADISDPTGFTSEEVQYVHDLSTKNPANVDQGRTYTFGISFHF